MQTEKVKAQFPDKPISVIDMRDYGTMNGKNVIAMVKKTLGDE